MQKRGLSIKSKLLLLLVLLPATMLGLYLALAMKTFKEDKIAYVYDSSGAVSKTLAAQTRAELESANASLKSIWSGFQDKTNAFSDLSKSLFSEEDNLLYVGIFRNVAGQIAKLQELTKTRISSSLLDSVSKKLIKQAEGPGFAMTRVGKQSNLIFVASRARGASEYVTAIIDAQGLIQAFDRPSSYSTFLISENGDIVAGPELAIEHFKSFDNWAFLKRIKAKQLHSMTTETEGSDHKKLLLSYSRVGKGGLGIVSLTEKETALQAVSVLLLKSVLFFIALISSSTIVSVFASRRSTKAIRDLFKATKKVSQGSYDIKVEVTSNDEIGSLATSFNQMGSEIQAAHEKLQDYAKNLEIKVEQRTKELADINRNLDAMVNSLGQGFLIFDAQGLCSPLFSKACLKLLETNPSEKPVWDVLKIRTDKSADFKNWCAMLFAEPLPFNDMVQIAPKVYDHSEKRHITLEYFPIRNAEQKLTGVVLVATDKTEELEATLLAKREAASAQRVLRITKNRDQFRTFIHGAGRIFDQVSKNLSRPKVDQAVIESVFQGIHTLKGDSGTFMLDFTFEKAHFFEEKIQDLKTASDDVRKKSSPALVEEIKLMETEFNKFIIENRDIVGDISENSKTLEVPFKDLTQFFGSLEANPKYKEIASIFQNQFLKEPIQKFFGHYNDLAEDVAKRRDKKVKSIAFKGGDLRVSGEVYSDLFSTFVHAIRNSIDHGIETPDDRTDIGKSAEGQVAIEFKRTDRKSKWLDIVFKDDGKGIDPKIIREKLSKNNIDTSSETDEQVIQHIFDNGFSTREIANELSGRGVGMGAIKAAAEALGGSAVISSHLGKGATLVVSVPELDSVPSKEAINTMGNMMGSRAA